MKTFSQIKIGDHLSNNCIDILVTSKTTKFINGYSLLKYRNTGKIVMNSIQIEAFKNRLITTDLVATTPIENIASFEELDIVCLAEVDLSTIEIY